MKKAFLDANVFFAAAGSPTGGSALIIQLGIQKKIEIVTVMHALNEAEQNINRKLGEREVMRHRENLLALKPTIQTLQSVSLEEVSFYAQLLPIKDVPIILGAVMSGADALVTLDRRDFLDNEKVQGTDLSVQIMTPGEFLEQL